MKKLVLKESVPFLGDVGDLVQVKNGYARNYLLPQSKALPALSHNIELMQRKRKQIDIKSAKDQEKALAIKKQLAGLTCTFTAKAREDNKLYGSVSAKDIAEYLAARSIDIDKKMVLLNDPIKAIGSYTISVRLHAEVTADVLLEVVAEA
ncbi:MAG: 50S ribosomal protein L9 [Pseudomonadota bacterium]